MRKLILLVLMLWAVPSWAATNYYVRTDGSDSNDGLADTSARAFLTLTKASETATTLDDIVYIAAGSYAGTHTHYAGTSGHPISFIGVGAVYLTSDFTVTHKYIAITNLEWVGVQHSSYGLIDVAAGSDGLRVTNCRFSYMASTSPTVRTLAIRLGYTLATKLWTDDVIIDGITVHDTSYTNVILACSNCYLKNSTFYNANTGVLISPSGHDVHIEDNILIYNLGGTSHPDVIQYQSASPNNANSISYNVYFERNIVKDSYAQVGNTSCDPGNCDGFHHWYLRNNVFQNVVGAFNVGFSHTEISNNLFYNTTTTTSGVSGPIQIMGYDYGDGHDAVIKNNIFLTRTSPSQGCPLNKTITYFGSISASGGTVTITFPYPHFLQSGWVISEIKGTTNFNESDLTITRVDDYTISYSSALTGAIEYNKRVTKAGATVALINAICVNTACTPTPAGEGIAKVTTRDRHGLAIGDTIAIVGTTGFDETAVVTYVSATTFRYATAKTGSESGSLRRYEYSLPWTHSNNYFGSFDGSYTAKTCDFAVAEVATAVNGVDPQFANAATGNYRPASASSPLVGAGANLSATGVDADSNPRPAAGAWTIGPFEWQGPPEYPSDVTAPIITSPAVNSTAIASTFTWTTTADASNSIVQYGLTGAYGSEQASQDLVTAHSITVSGLTPNTLYYYRLASRDAAGNLSDWTPGTFTTGGQSRARMRKRP